MLVTGSWVIDHGQENKVFLRPEVALPGAFAAGWQGSHLWEGQQMWLCWDTWIVMCRTKPNAFRSLPLFLVRQLIKKFLWGASTGQVLPDHRAGDRETATVTTLSGEEVDLFRGFPARDTFYWGQE